MHHKRLVSLSAVCSIVLASFVSVDARVQVAAHPPARLTAKQLLPKTGERYETKPMIDARQGEDKKIVDHGVLIHYMNKAEREAARVVIVNGMLYTSKGKPVPYG